MTSTRYLISPLIRYSLYSLYLALVLPLPFLLKQQTGSIIAIGGLGITLGLGGLVLIGALSQRVDVDEQGIAVSYPRWVPGWFQRGWTLGWSQIVGIHTSSTSQGGLAYYLVSQSQDRYLLPMRIQSVKRLLEVIQARTGQDTSSVYPYVQPWMYLILAGCAGVLLLCDLGVIGLTLTSPPLG